MWSLQRARSALKPAKRLLAGERDVEQVAKLPVEVAGAALRVFEGPDGTRSRRPRKPLGQQAQRDALAGAGVTGDEREAAVGDPEFDALEGRLSTAGVT
jgi:hypothetical protein